MALSRGNNLPQFIEESRMGTPGISLEWDSDDMAWRNSEKRRCPPSMTRPHSSSPVLQLTPPPLRGMVSAIDPHPNMTSEETQQPLSKLKLVAGISSWCPSMTTESTESRNAGNLAHVDVTDGTWQSSREQQSESVRLREPSSEEKEMQRVASERQHGTAEETMEENPDDVKYLGTLNSPLPPSRSTSEPVIGATKNYLEEATSQSEVISTGDWSSTGSRDPLVPLRGYDSEHGPPTPVCCSAVGIAETALTFIEETQSQANIVDQELGIQEAPDMMDAQPLIIEEVVAIDTAEDLHVTVDSQPEMESCEADHPQRGTAEETENGTPDKEQHRLEEEVDPPDPEGCLESRKNKNCKPVLRRAANSEPDLRIGDGSEEIITPTFITNRELGARTLSVQVQVGQRKLAAVVDSGAQVTVLNSRLEITVLPGEPEKVVLVGIGRNGKVPAEVALLDFRLGKRWYQEKVCIADVGDDDMLLGIDFLRKHRMTMDFEKNCLRLPAAIIPAYSQSLPGTPSFRTSRVVASAPVVVPAASAIYVDVLIDPPLHAEAVFTPGIEESWVLLPSVLLPGGTMARVPMVNFLEYPLEVGQGMLLGLATEVDKEEIVYESLRMRTLSCSDLRDTEGPIGAGECLLDLEEIVQQTPGHLRELIRTAATNLTTYEIRQVAKLLLDYQDIFSNDDINLGFLVHRQEDADS